MSNEKKDSSPVRNPIAWVFHTSLLLCGAVIALNVAIAYLQPILPWLIGGLMAAGTAWLVVAIIRWRRSKW